MSVCCYLSLCLPFRNINVSNLYSFKILLKLFNTVSSGFRLVENDRKLETLLSSIFQHIFLWELIEALLLFLTTKPKKIMEEN